MRMLYPLCGNNLDLERHGRDDHRSHHLEQPEQAVRRDEVKLSGIEPTLVG